MGADGSILIVDTKKAKELFGEKKWKEIKDSAPTCVYSHKIFGNEVTTFYSGDNMTDSFWNKKDWYCENKTGLADLFLDNLDKIEIDQWEVCT